MAYFGWHGNGPIPDTIIEYATANPGFRIKQATRAFVSRPGKPHTRGDLWLFCEGCTGVEEECPEHGNGVE